MKKLLVSMLAICTVAAFCACGGSEDNNQAPDTQVTDTQTVVADTQKEEVETEAVADGKVNYKVTVVDEAGNPIVGALVQLCNESCFPSATGEDGTASFSLDEANYKVSFLTLPAGYTYSGDAQEFYFEAGSVEMTITLKPEA